MSEEIEENMNNSALLGAIVSGGIIAGTIGIFENNFSSSKYILPTAMVVGITTNYLLTKQTNESAVEMVKTYWEEAKEVLGVSDHTGYYRYMAGTMAGMLTFALGYKAIIRLGQWSPGYMGGFSDISSTSVPSGVGVFGPNPGIIKTVVQGGAMLAPAIKSGAVSRILAPTIMQLIVSASKGDVVRRSGLQLAAGVVAEVFKNSGLAASVKDALAKKLTGLQLDKFVSDTIGSLSKQLSETLTLMSDNLHITNERVVVLQDPHGGESFALLIDNETNQQQAIPCMRMNASDWADIRDSAKQSLNITPFAQPPSTSSGGSIVMANLGPPPPDEDEKSDIIALTGTIPRWVGDNYYPSSRTGFALQAAIASDVMLATTILTRGTISVPSGSGSVWGTLAAISPGTSNANTDVTYTFDSGDPMHYFQIALNALKYKRLDPSMRPWPIAHGDLSVGTRVVFLKKLNMSAGEYIVLHIDNRVGVVIIGNIHTGKRLIVPRFALDLDSDTSCSQSSGSGVNVPDFTDLVPNCGLFLPSSDYPSHVTSPSKKGKDGKDGLRRLGHDLLPLTIYKKALKGQTKPPGRGMMNDVRTWMEFNRVISRAAGPWLPIAFIWNTQALVGTLESKIQNVSLDYHYHMVDVAILNEQMKPLQTSADIHKIQDNRNVFFKKKHAPLLYEAVQIPGHNSWFVMVEKPKGNFAIFRELETDGLGEHWLINLGATELSLRGDPAWGKYRNIINWKQSRH